MFDAHLSVRVTIDSGATGNMIRHTVVQRLGCQVTPSSQSVHQADGSSPLHVVGETRFPFTCKGHTFTFEGLIVEKLDSRQLPVSPPPKPPVHQPSTKHSVNVNLDSNNLLPQDIRAKCTSLLDEYDHIFDPNIKGYNGAEGPFKARVNMGPVEPPQRKGRLRQYVRHQLLELQQKFDELETLGVFKRPEDISIPVEYLNPSFHVKKPSGG